MSRRHTLSLLVWSCQNHLRIAILRWPTYCWRQEPYRCYIAKGQATWCFMYGIWYWWLNWYCWPQIVRSHYWSQSLSTLFTSTTARRSYSLRKRQHGYQLAVSSIAVSLTLGDYCFLYTIYHIQAYTLPLPLNPIKIGIFVVIHHTVLC